MLTWNVCTPPDVVGVPTVQVDSEGAPVQVTVTVGEKPAEGVTATEKLPFPPATTLASVVVRTVISTTDWVTPEDVDCKNVVSP